MKRLATSIAALSLAVLAAPAFADEARFVNNEIGYQTLLSPSKLTRAQVIAQLEQAQRSGELAASYEFAQPLDLAASAKSREQVQREAAQVSDRERTAQNALYGPNA
ncbi:MAG: DUF4148 domain-containing protein [Burkholderiaceae bacterium]|jgi:hypothetical protein|nr:DUF4148 domain-containing protein [Burkholderiaceae bacterium]